jgi:hypothetical protein
VPQGVASRSGCIIEMQSEDARCLVVPMTAADEVVLLHRYGLALGLIGSFGS